MRVVYSDESGTGDRETQPITVVAGILLNMRTQWPLAEYFMRKVAEAFPEFLTGDTKEFKGSRLFRAFRRGADPHRAAAAMMGVLAVVEEVKCPIFYGAVDRAGLRRSQSRPRTPRELKARTSLDWAFHDCMKATERYINTLVPREDVLWIHDEAGHQEAALRTALSMFNQNTGLGTRIRISPAEYEDLHPITNRKGAILDTIYFGHSEYSRALQLADVCAAVIRARVEGHRDSAAFYEIIRSAIVGDGQSPRFAAKSRSR